MKNLRFFILSIILVLPIEYCTAESFLVNRSKPKSIGRIKQEIVEVLADLLQQECKIIELKAQIQQNLCKCIGQLAENDKSSCFAKSNKKELQAILDKLQSIKESNNVQINQLNENLDFIRSKSEFQTNLKENNNINQN